MESGAEGANSVNRVSRWPTCRSERVERGCELQSADSKSDRVLELGRRGGGTFEGTDEDEEEDGEQDGSGPTKLSGQPGIEICRRSWM